MIELEKAITALVDNNVDFVIIGGVAVTLHSSAYITRDFDLCYSRTNENLKKIVIALGQFDPRPRGFPEGLPYIFDEATIRNGSNFTFETSIGDIDILGGVEGVGNYNDAVANSDIFNIYGRDVNVLNLDALIASKAAANRPKDHLVLPELLALKEAFDTDSQ